MSDHRTVRLRHEAVSRDDRAPSRGERRVRNVGGPVTQNWPFNLIEYWQQTRKPDPTDFEFR